MINIDEIKPLIIERLKPLKPSKIILFGSYAYGTPTENSDIDLFLINNQQKIKSREYNLLAMKLLRDLVFKYKIGFDILNSTEEFLRQRDDYFYKIDILEKGKVIYGQ